MIRIIEFIFIFALIVFCANSQELPEYTQCNGENWSGLVKCKPGLKCMRQNQYYSQCLKTCPAGWECSSECLENNCQQLVPEYGQCGGSNYKGPTKCASNLNCYKYNKWYSQCLQKCPCGWECCG